MCWRRLYSQWFGAGGEWMTKVLLPPEGRLPPDVLGKASLRGNEYAWRLADVAEAVTAARDAGLATLGGQVQFRTPDGICDLYWLNADADDRRPDEDWPTFVVRSADQVLRGFAGLIAGTDFVAEAVRHPGHIAELQSLGHELKEYLWFAVSFCDKERESQLRQLREDLTARAFMRT